MSTKISSVPFEVEIALCQIDLKQDRREIRDARALMDQRRIRTAAERSEDAIVARAFGSTVDLLRNAIQSGTSANEGFAPSPAVEGPPTPEELKSACAESVQDAFKKAFEDIGAQLHQDAAEMRGAELGEDAASRSSERLSATLSKLKRPRG